MNGKTRVLLILPSEIVDRARVFAGKAMSALKLPVSLQIVFRVLIEQGLKRGGDQALRARVASEATAVHQRRSRTERTSAGRRPASRREQAAARKRERGRSDAVVKWVAAIAWATVAAVTLGCGQPAPALTTEPPTSLAAPVSAGVPAGEAAKENVGAEGQTSQATEEASLKAAAFYLYLLIRSR